MKPFVKQLISLGTDNKMHLNLLNNIRAHLGVARAALQSLGVIWKDCALQNSTKLKVMKIVVWPITTYGCN